MSKAHILIIDADFDTAELLRIYFEGQDYEVSIASRGEDGLAMLHEKLLHLVILDAELPGMDGYEVCREVKWATRTSHIPVIFLTETGEHSDKIKGLELGADDCITKPFNIDDVMLRARNAIDRIEWGKIASIFDPLPGLALIKEQLRVLQKTSKAWTYIDLKVEYFDAFREIYGEAASTEALRLVTLSLAEIIDELGTPEDFVGYPSPGSFVVITYSDKADQLEAQIIERLNVEELHHYTQIDRQQQNIILPTGEEHPLMALSTCSTNQFPIEGISIS